MKIYELTKHKDFPEMLLVDPTTRITASSNPNLNALVYYEQQTVDLARLEIGKYCSIATKVSFYLGGNHNTARISTWLPTPDMRYDSKRDLLTKGNILVGNDVWIARDTTIMSGVTIGNGAVIGTGAVVAKDVEPYSIVVGNPARSVRKRFTDEQIELLQKAEWWSWGHKVITDNSAVIFGESFDEFEKLAKKLGKA